jgi:hypothetical protein
VRLPQLASIIETQSARIVARIAILNENPL